ncbi:hypothetical protein SAMN05216566_11251 [Aureimonas phyllosphaerae]|nr:hypothetical protein SAMN05216566_11251 [Aureimonas phyllosphaerae]
MNAMPSFRTCLAMSLALAAVPNAAAAGTYVFRSKAAVIGATSGTVPPVTERLPPQVGVNGYAGKLNGRDVWVSSEERLGTWGSFGSEGPFHSGGSSRDDGKANTDAQASHIRGAEVLAAQFCKSLAPIDGQPWHLPAFNELRFVIGAIRYASFQSGQRYWTSSELDAAANVLSVSAEGGAQSSGKAANATYRTRCIRYGA